MYAFNAWSVWKQHEEIFDKINGSRTFNLHRKNVVTLQGTNSASMYFTKVKDM